MFSSDYIRSLDSVFAKAAALKAYIFLCNVIDTIFERRYIALEEYAAVKWDFSNAVDKHQKKASVFRLQTVATSVSENWYRVY